MERHEYDRVIAVATKALGSLGPCTALSNLVAEAESAQSVAAATTPAVRQRPRL